MRDRVVRAYLLGAFGDGTVSRRHRTYRFSQRERSWLEALQRLLAELGHRSWIYREGQQRNLHVLETSAAFLGASEDPGPLTSQPEQAAYVRGYFDAEGGIPQRSDARLYVQFVQKDRGSLTRVRQLLGQLGVDCGVIHNPSRRVDPEYWRFFVRTDSHRRFIEAVGSWHPRKAMLLSERVKI